MIRVLTGSQMKNIDQKAVQELGIPGLILMENAGRAVFEQIMDIIEETKLEISAVLVIAGKGNNGGDGFVAARHLLEEGIDTYVVSLFAEEEFSGDALTNLNILKNFTDIIYFDEIEQEDFQDLVSSSDIIIDAIFGTGLLSEPKGKTRLVIDIINEYSEGYIVSVDVPSGVDSNTAKILGSAVVADYTTTFFAPKLGTVLYPGSEFAGEVYINDIGIPKNLLEIPEFKINIITRNHASVLLPLRPDDSHKGMFGNVFTLAGSFGMTGAAYFAAYSALKAGAGYSTLATGKSSASTIAAQAPDIVFVPLPETEDGFISEKALDIVLEKSEKSNVYLIGPGLGAAESSIKLVEGFIRKLTDRGLNTIIDADGLNCLSMLENMVLPVNSVITPHAKELSRLLKTTVEEVLEDRIAAATKAAAEFNTIVVLKGARTIIASPDGRIFISPVGSSALAKAGTGDVLSGIIAGLAAQEIELLNAAVLGVYIHGMAGEIASEYLTEHSVTASELINYIPDAIKVLED